jgi:hypothetical protein
MSTAIIWCDDGKPLVLASTHGTVGWATQPDGGGLWLAIDGQFRRLTNDEAIALATEQRMPWEVPTISDEAYERALFFGCWGSKGHYLRDRRAEMVYGEKQPWGDSIDSRLAPPLDKRHGAHALHHRNGWTAWAMWDYSLDHRGASNAAFLAPGKHSLEAMRMIAARCFGPLLERIASYVDPPGRWYGSDYKGPT